jgi:hypothetical protein
MRFCHVLPTLLSTTFATASVADAAAASSDWLLAAVPTAPSVSDGTLGGVATITLQNGLVSRTFAIVPGVPTPSPPPPPPGIPCPPPPQCTTCGNRTHCCPNPGNKFHHGPDSGEVYPYFGMPCDQQSDCAQCTCFLRPTCPHAQVGRMPSCFGQLHARMHIPRPLALCWRVYEWLWMFLRLLCIVQLFECDLPLRLAA